MRVGQSKTEVFTNSRDGERLIVGYTNWGDPYEEGARFSLHANGQCSTVELERRELERLHEHLGDLLKTMK